MPSQSPGERLPHQNSGFSQVTNCKKKFAAKVGCVNFRGKVLSKEEKRGKLSVGNHNVYYNFPSHNYFSYM